MNLSAVLLASLPTLVFGTGCGSESTANGVSGQQSSNTGGANTGTGGSAPTGGSRGLEPKGGTFAVGGTTNTRAGGASSTTAAGTATTGGHPSVGGSRASGGTKATISSAETGGTQATGGANATGGATISTGGAAATGGSRNTGGTPSTGGTTGSRASSTGGSTASHTGGSAGTAGSSGGYPLKNTPVASAGCGKPLSTIKSGTNTYKMTSAGLNREYIVTLPDGYDPNVPHRLIFGMHWMNGSADAVQGWSKWFGLKELDTENTTVFVAPQGYTDAMPWRSDNKDHVFFNELYASLASALCIDTSRVFSVGFSFGAMYTNALAQDHQDVLRGIVVYATADYNIYFPANTGKPLAYMGVHGLKDPTCPIDAGRRSRDRFVKNNGCAVPGTVPEAKAGGNYVTYDYTCPSNYPVRWVTFDGKHTYPPNDTGTWVYGSTWEFITQF